MVDLGRKSQPGLSSPKWQKAFSPKAFSIFFHLSLSLSLGKVATSAGDPFQTQRPSAGLTDRRSAQ